MRAFVACFVNLLLFHWNIFKLVRKSCKTKCQLFYVKMFTYTLSEYYHYLFQYKTNFKLRLWFSEISQLNILYYAILLVLFRHFCLFIIYYSIDLLPNLFLYKIYVLHTYFPVELISHLYLRFLMIRWRVLSGAGSTQSH